MALSMFDPFREFNRVLDAPLFGQGSLLSGGTQELQRWNPRLDVKQTDKEVMVTAELPGVKKEDINVELNNGMLTISGEKKEEKKQQTDRYFRSERVYGSFSRSIAVPEGVTDKDIKANYNNGILEVKFPNLNAQEQKKAKIMIQGTDTQQAR